MDKYNIFHNINEYPDYYIYIMYIYLPTHININDLNIA